MNKQEIIAVLKDLHKISGFRVSLHGADYSEIAAYPELKHEFCRTLQSLKNASPVTSSRVRPRSQ